MWLAALLTGAGMLALVIVVLGGAREPGPPQSVSDSSTDATVQPTVPGDLDGGLLLITSVETRDGGSTTIAADLDGRPIVINFWAEWCAPCIAEMPTLEQASLDNAGVRFVGINEMDASEQAEAMAEKTGITYQWFLDPDGSFAAASRTINLPTTLLLRADGTVAATRVGAFRSSGDFQGWLDDAEVVVDSGDQSGG